MICKTVAAGMRPPFAFLRASGRVYGDKKKTHRHIEKQIDKSLNFCILIK